VVETAELLESLGHSVDEAPPFADERYVENFIKIWTAGVADEVHTYGRLRGKPLDLDKLEPLTREMVALADSWKATDYLAALDHLRQMSRQLVATWSDLDILISPTVAQPPLPIGALAPREGEPAFQWLLNAAEWVPFTPVWNVTGQPAISLPLHQTGDGLPVGVQFVGPPAGEALLLSLASQLESARPWHARRPELAAA
jgi:amidase